MARASLATGGMVIFQCPGCNGHHGVSTDPSNPNNLTGAFWSWNGSVEKPTFRPSILVHPSETIDDEPYPENATKEEVSEWCDKHRIKTPRCHSYVTDGQIQFLSDCEHKLAGQTVDLPEEY